MNDNWGFSDEDLDGLFRQAAEGQRPRFEPEDWRQMAARLDEAGRDGTLPPPALPWYRRWAWLALAGLLLLTGLTVWLVPRSERRGIARPTAAPARSGAGTPNRQVPTEVERLAKSEPASAASARATERTDEPGAAPRAIPAAEPEGEPRAAAGRVVETPAAPRGQAGVKAEPKTAPRDGATPGAKPVSANPGEKTVGTERRPASAPAGQGRAEVVSGKVLSPKTEVRGKPATAPPEGTTGHVQPARGTTATRPNRTAKLTQPARENAPARAGLSTPPERATRRTDAPPPAPTADETASDRWQTPPLTRLRPRQISFRRVNLPVEEPNLSQFSAYYTPPARRAEVPPRGRLGVRALLAPDLNAVTRMQTFAFGRSFGILAEYEFLPRWRVQAGAVRSQKDYGSTPDDYTPPIPGYWARYGRPETIDARCAILDVPLNVRFDALRRSRHDLFVSTGLSTYVMLDEVYDYHFATRPSYTHEVYRGGRHLASTLNLSAGYERQLGAGFSLQVEPYLKLPLAGVGWGSVRLYSTGLHLSLGFHRVR